MTDTKARGVKLPHPQKIYRALHPVGWNIRGIVLELILGEETLRLAGIESAMYPRRFNSDGYLAW